MRLPYQKLIVREKSMTLAKEVYILTKKLPKEEMWRFCSQLRRASVSVPSNIAEGNAKSSDKHFVIFLENSLGSLFEVETQLLLAKDI